MSPSPCKVTMIELMKILESQLFGNFLWWIEWQTDFANTDFSYLIMSGTEVPIAKMVRPMTDWGMPKLSPIVIAIHTWKEKNREWHKLWDQSTSCVCVCVSGCVSLSVCVCVCVCVCEKRMCGYVLAPYHQQSTSVQETHCNTSQHTASHCITLHHAAPRCTTLHHTTPHWNTPWRRRRRQSTQWT